MDKYCIWGCGAYGKRVLEELGTDRVSCFIDNNSDLWGNCIEGISVIGINEWLKNYSNDKIVIPASDYYYQVKKQLRDLGITNTSIYMPIIKYGSELYINPYEGDNKGLDYEYKKTENNRSLIKEYSIQLLNTPTLFNSIEIETYNRCNGICSFCPVSVKNESRKEEKMSSELFEKIIDNLAELKYNKRLSLFSNNEPFLDERIIEFQKQARQKLPDAYLYLYTNGTLLTEDKLIQIIPYIDKIIIDNYSSKYTMIPNVERIFEMCKRDTKLKDKITIYIRDPHEILTTRGGDSPNKNDVVSEYDDDSCLLPFKQFIVRPDGKVSLCCNDPLGKYSLGDLNTQSIEEIWYGDNYKKIRNQIVMGRKNIEKCRRCDVISIM